MKLVELETRLAALEKEVQELRTLVGKDLNGKEPWWISEAGHFANDPGFDEIVRLGREYRESLHPDRRKKKTSKKKTSKKTNNARS